MSTTILSVSEAARPPKKAASVNYPKGGYPGNSCHLQQYHLHEHDVCDTCFSNTIVNRRNTERSNGRGTCNITSSAQQKRPANTNMTITTTTHQTLENNATSCMLIHFQSAEPVHNTKSYPHVRNTMRLSWLFVRRQLSISTFSLEMTIHDSCNQSCHKCYDLPVHVRKPSTLAARCAQTSFRARSQCHLPKRPFVAHSLHARGSSGPNLATTRKNARFPTHR